jgi:cation transport regulator ChaB
MPYDRNDQLPKPVTHTLPGHAQDIFRNVVNSAISGGASDESAHRQAWGAVSHSYKRPKGGGRWSARGKKIKKAGASLSYSSWTTQQQKVAAPGSPGSPESTSIEGRLHVSGRKKRRRLMDRGLWKGYPEYNPDQSRGSDGRWSGGGGAGGGVSEGRARGKKTKQPSLKSIRAAYTKTKKERDKVARNIRNLQARMTQFKRNSQAYRNSYKRLGDLKAQRTEMTRAMAKLSAMHSKRTAGSANWDWIQGMVTGLPIMRRTSGRSLGKAEVDLFAVRGHF